MSNDSTLKHDNIIKLQKVLSLWKSKNTCDGSRLVNNSGFKVRKPNTDQQVMFLGRKISKKELQPNSIEDITITSQRLCEEYIEARLARSGMKGFDQDRSETNTEYSNVLQNMGQILEMKYPRLYTKLSVHLKVNYNSEIVVWDSFNKFGGHLFSDGTTWAKIIAFYAFTGGLALDSVTYGKNEMPGRMVYWFGIFVSKHLASWIKEQGGWDSIVEHFNSDDDSNVPGHQFDGYDEDSDDERINLVVKIRCFLEEKRTAMLVSAFIIIFFVLFINVCL